MSTRRAFLQAAGATAALVVTAALQPQTFAAAVVLGEEVDPPLPSPQTPARAADGEPWDIDDIWGPAPRYALAIPHSPVRTSPVLWEHVDPIDRMLVT